MLSLALTSAAGAASAQTAASVHVGTAGAGAEVKMALGPSFVVRVGVDRLRHDFDQTYSGVDYGAELDFDTVGENGPEKEGTVTLRHRDSMQQERVAIADLKPFLLERIA